MITVEQHKERIRAYEFLKWTLEELHSCNEPTHYMLHHLRSLMMKDAERHITTGAEDEALYIEWRKFFKKDINELHKEKK